MTIPRRPRKPGFGLAFILATMTTLSLVLLLVGCQLLGQTTPTTEGPTTSTTVQGMTSEEYTQLLDESAGRLEVLATTTQDLTYEWWKQWSHEMESVTSRRFSDIVLVYFYEDYTEELFGPTISGYNDTADIGSGLVREDYFAIPYRYDLPYGSYSTREEMMTDFFGMLERHLEDIRSALSTMPFQDEYKGTQDDKEILRSLGGLLYKLETRTGLAKGEVMRNMQDVAEYDERREDRLWMYQ
ncbi:MAG: hypothetical protein ACYC33_11970 [Thermoleophilia bacterium]